jgi:hypothetical protein
MKPCDCRDQQDAKSITEQGIAINEWSLLVNPASVEIEHRHYGKIILPMSVFTKFVKWYLEDQKNN